jgi:hypothetical protein
MGNPRQQKAPNLPAQTSFYSRSRAISDLRPLNTPPELSFRGGRAIFLVMENGSSMELSQLALFGS